MTCHNKNKVQGLTEMSARAVLKGMQLEDDPAKLWFSLGEHMQRLVFPYLWEQCMEGLEIKRQAKSADSNLYVGHGLDYRGQICEGDENQDGTGACHVVYEPTSKKEDASSFDSQLVEAVEERLDLKRDPYFLKQHFKSTWRLLPSQNSTYAQRSNDIAWVGWNLCRASRDASLEVHTGYGDPPCGSRRLSLRDLISSQLLLYRLVAVFGMPSSMDYAEDHGTVWAMVLVHGEESDESDGRLAFEDFKGGAHVAFQGSVAASDRAVELVEWLVGNNIPHGSYYRLLGTAD